MKTPTPEYITIAEAAQRLGLSVRTVRRMITRQELPGHRIGPRAVRIPAEAVATVGKNLSPWPKA